MKNREPHSLSSTLQLARGLAMALAVAASAGGVAAQTYINATVGGQIAPGVYGRVDIGNSAPALLYPQPVVIAPPAVYVPRSPIYMYVPPGHAKNWSKHCARYSACGQPVYFVKEPRAGPANSAMTATGSMAVRLTMAAATGTAATGTMTIAAVGMEKATATAEATGAVIAEAGLKPGI